MNFNGVIKSNSPEYLSEIVGQQIDFGHDRLFFRLFVRLWLGCNFLRHFIVRGRAAWVAVQIDYEIDSCWNNMRRIKQQFVQLGMAMKEMCARKLCKTNDWIFIQIAFDHDVTLQSNSRLELTWTRNAEQIKYATVRI